MDMEHKEEEKEGPHVSEWERERRVRYEEEDLASLLKEEKL